MQPKFTVCSYLKGLLVDSNVEITRGIWYCNSMIIEATHCKGLPVVDSSGTEYGVIDFLVYDGKIGQAVGLQVAKSGVVKKFFGLEWRDIASSNRRAIVIHDKSALKTNLKDLDNIYHHYGRVINVTATTESGKRIGRISDVLIDADTGLIVRFVIRSLFHERIIPRHFLVSITPNAVVFQDVVDQPIFDKLAIEIPIIEPTA